MKAITIPSYGGPDALSLSDVPKRDPFGTQLLVRVAACGINPVDAKIRKGALPLPFTFPLILGYDVSGTVEAAGPGVRDFGLGDEVYFSGELLDPGAYAEYVIVDESVAAFKPVGLSHVEAASVPVAGMTAWQALFDRAGAGPGDVVLVHGAAGGVGSMAVQLASWAGCEVLATCGKSNIAYVEDLGADLVIDYKAQDFVQEVLEATADEGVSVVVDTVGGEVLTRSLEALMPGGRLVSLVPENLSGLPLESLRPGFMRNAEIHLHFMERRRDALDALARLFERGFLEPSVEEVIPLDPTRIGSAHGRMESSHGRGKIVIQVDKE
ncbi:MAG: NADP-dependent oxidoreductase [Acidobacteriota bacterium]